MITARATVFFCSMIAVAVLPSCGGETNGPVPSDPSSLQLARGAVEVGMIQLGQMTAFQANVDGMNIADREALESKLIMLHDGFHSRAGTAGPTPQGESEGAGGSCLYFPCSHSEWEPDYTKAMWCCAFGEDRMYYLPGPLVE